MQGPNVPEAPSITESATLKFAELQRVLSADAASVRLSGLGGPPRPVLVLDVEAAAAAAHRVVGEDAWVLYPAGIEMGVPLSFFGAGPMPPPERYESMHQQACVNAFRKVCTAFAEVARYADLLSYPLEAHCAAVHKAMKTVFKILSDASKALGDAAGSDASKVLVLSAAVPRPLKPSNKIIATALSFPRVNELLLMLG